MSDLTPEQWLAAYPPPVVDTPPKDPLFKSTSYWDVDRAKDAEEVAQDRGGFAIVQCGDIYYLITL